MGEERVPVTASAKGDGAAMGGALLAACVAVSACCSALASPRVPWFLCVSILPLFVAIRLLSPMRSMLCGALWGAVFCVVSACIGASRIDPSLAVVILLVVVPATYTLVGGLLTRWVGFSPLVLATGWIAVELALRPVGLRTGLLVDAMAEGWLLQFVGGLLGYVFVAFFLAYISALLLEFAVSIRLWSSRPPRRTASSDPRLLSVPHVAAWSPRFAVRFSQPRAPPATA